MDSVKLLPETEKINCFLLCILLYPCLFYASLREAELFTRGSPEPSQWKDQTFTTVFPLFQPIGRGSAQKYPGESPGSAHRTPFP